MDESQRGEIQAYVNRSDREAEPVFVGREDLFGIVASAASACADGHPQGQTVCVSGPPGVGKTAFLTELRRRCRGQWDGPPLLMAGVGADELRDPQTLLARIDKAALAAAGKGLRKRWRGLRRGFAQRGGSITVAGVGGGLGADRSARFPWEELESVLKAEPKGAVLCVHVDEAQLLTPTPDSAVNHVLSALHQGRADVPAFVLLAGLSHLPDVVEPTISRLAGGRTVRLQPLDRADAKAYVRGVFNHLGVQGTTRSRHKVVDWVASECGGFPHHLRSAMTALGREMLRSGAADLKDLDLNRTALEMAELRVDYYQSRLSKLDEVMPPARKLLEKWGPAGVPREQAKADARAMLTRQDADLKAELQAVGVNTGKALVDLMIRKGLLAANADNRRWRCLIPSLRQYALTGTFQTRPPPDLRRGGIGG